MYVETTVAATLWFPGNQAKWVAVAVVVVKFLVDWLFMKITKSVRGNFAAWNSEP